ncbi:MAG: zinc ribbon domain-containing protein [Fulvivirga sp.]
MKKKECPSCAMEVDAKSKECPICGYEFPGFSKGYQWIAIVLVIIFLLYFIF